MVSAIAKLFDLYLVLIILRCFFSFFPRINTYKQPVKFIFDVTEPYLALFRSFIPPINGLDFSPIIAMLALQFIGLFFCSALARVFGM